MAVSMEEIILRVRGVGLPETSAEVAALRDEVAGLGDTTIASGEKMSAGIGLFGRGMGGLAAAVGISGAVIGIKDLVKQGMALQREQQNLRAALDGVGQTGKAAYNEVYDSAIKLATHGGFARPEELTSITNFIGQLHNVKEAQEAELATVELARAKNLQWGAAQMAVSRALAGNTTRLAQYVGFVKQAKNAEATLQAQEQQRLFMLKEQYKGIGVAGQSLYEQRAIQIRESYKLQEQNAEAVDKSITAQQILNGVTKQYPDALKAYNNSVAGVANNLKSSFQIMISDIGESLLPYVKIVLEAFRGLFDFLDKNRWILVVVASGAGLMGIYEATKLVWSGLNIMRTAFIRNIIAVGDWMKGLIGAKGAAIELTEQQRIEAAAIANLSSEDRELYMSLEGVEKGQLAVIKAAMKMSGEITENLALLREWRGTLAELDGTMAVTTGQIGEQLALFPTLQAEEEGTTIATRVMAGAMGMLSTAMDMIPGLVLFTALGILITEAMQHTKLFADAFVAAWHWIEGAASDVFSFIKSHLTIFEFALSPILGPIALIVAGFKEIIRVGETVARIVNSIFGGNAPNRRFRAEQAAGGQHFGTMSRFATGGPVRPAKYLDVGGPSGTDVVPAWLSPGEFVLNSATAQQIGAPTLNAWNSGAYGGGQQNITIHPSPIVLNLDSRTLARAVVRYTIERAARGPSSLVGGSIVTGSGGPSTAVD